jgi:hypothetical protein
MIFHFIQDKEIKSNTFSSPVYLYKRDFQFKITLVFNIDLYDFLTNDQYNQD